jgi:endonuclease-3
MSKPSVRVILSLLEEAYGPRRPGPGRDPIAVLVETMLSQNTSDSNSGRAFASLMRTFGSWERIADADEGAIEETIRTGGLGQIKAHRIKEVLEGIREQRGKLDLNFLDKLSIPEARQWLKGLKGIGNKTANCVLLFASGRPALPVDTHIYRVSGRLGLLPAGNENLDQAHRILGDLVPPEDVYDFHVLMIEHGRKTCTARSPHCLSCVLGKVCPSYERLTGHPAGGAAAPRSGK